MDEEFSTYDPQIIQRFIYWFWEQDRDVKRAGRIPEAVLVVTCRDIDDFQSYWCRSITGSGLTRSVAGVSVGAFSDYELREAISMAPAEILESEARRRILQTLDISTISDIDASILPETFYSYATRVPRVDRSILRAIHHPVIFGEFLQLDSAEQLGLLNYETVSLMNLAQAIVNRFIDKVYHRGKLGGLRKEDVLILLADIANGAASSPENQLWLEYKKWTESIARSGLVNDSQCNTLYIEAISGGLIQESSRRSWQWSYPWIWEYLVSEI